MFFFFLKTGYVKDNIKSYLGVYLRPELFEDIKIPKKINFLIDRLFRIKCFSFSEAFFGLSNFWREDFTTLFLFTFFISISCVVIILNTRRILLILLNFCYH